MSTREQDVLARLRSRETTQLPPEQERAFERWARGNHVQDVDSPEAAYDYRGYWLHGGDHPIRWGVDHFPDTYKQHGHPTFSVESTYSTGQDDGGHWVGETYAPGDTLPVDSILHRLARGNAAPSPSPAPTRQGATSTRRRRP